MAKVGRKTVMTPIVCQKLEEVAALDGTVEEMCFYANISRDTYYTYIKENKEFSDRIDDLRNTPVLKARRAVNEKMSESYQNAIDYLKRKRKKEFGDNVDVTTGHEKLPQSLVDLNALLANNIPKENSPAPKEN